MTEYILNNGIKMPALGIGTYLLTPEEAERSVLSALGCGYRLVDTANAYCNEKAVGRAIKTFGDREEVFISTKLWPVEYENERAVDQTLARLGVDYVDLLFLHQPAGNWLAGYRQLERAYKQGKIKSIGISNFEGRYFDELLKACEIKPQVMQVECHPYYPQTELRALTDGQGIKIMSWYPLGGKGNDGLLNNAVVRATAKKHGKTAAQVILRWHLQMGIIVIPGSKNASHIAENFAANDFELDQEDMRAFASIDKNTRYYNRTDAALAAFAAWQPAYEK